MLRCSELVNLVFAPSTVRLGNSKEADAAVQLALDESLNGGRGYRRATCAAVRALIRQHENHTDEARAPLADVEKSLAR